PWPEPVETKALLTDVMAQLKRYVVIHDDACAVAIVLWVMYAWVHEIGVHSTFLVFSSADADSGKTTLCGVLQRLTPRAYAAARRLQRGPDYVQALCRLVHQVGARQHRRARDRAMAAWRGRFRPCWLPRVDR